MTNARDILDAAYVQDRPVPDGFTGQWDFTMWNVGFVFRWSDVFEAWMDEGVTVTVKPGMTLDEAFEARMDHPMWLGYAIFFAEGF